MRPTVRYGLDELRFRPIHLMRERERERFPDLLQFVSQPRISLLAQLTVSAPHTFSGVLAIYVTYTVLSVVIAVSAILVLQSLLQVLQRPQPARLEFIDPAIGDLMNRHGVEVMQLLANAPNRGDQVGL